MSYKLFMMIKTLRGSKSEREKTGRAVTKHAKDSLNG